MIPVLGYVGRSKPGAVDFAERGRPGALAPNAVVGMVIFVVAEIMFFSGLVSAFRIVRTSALGSWPPADQPRLPIEATAVNTLVLVSSAFVLHTAVARFKERDHGAQRLCLATLLLGSGFVLFQGVEWVRLTIAGLTMTSSTHGSFFYLIVGAHALHVLGALAALGYVYALFRWGRLSLSTLRAVQILWYFVVALWPVLYWQVYLS